MRWKKLMRELDQEKLEELRRSVVAEIAARRPAIEIADIHPRMTPAEKEAVTQKIARVLRGEDA